MMRPMIPSDSPQLIAMMDKEGYRGGEVEIENTATFVLLDNEIKGFFSIKMANNMPYLSHFVTKKEFRSHSLARKLVTWFKTVVRGFGFSKAVVNVPEGNEYLNRLVQRYFSVQPYAVEQNKQFYLVEV